MNWISKDNNTRLIRGESGLRQKIETSVSMDVPTIPHSDRHMWHRIIATTFMQHFSIDHDFHMTHIFHDAYDSQMHCTFSTFRFMDDDVLSLIMDIMDIVTCSVDAQIHMLCFS